MIVGAGIAGLATAFELRAIGFTDVIVLESRDRIGGRIWTSKIGDFPIDLGASWIHGIDDNPIAKIAAENDITIATTNYDNEATHFQDAAMSDQSKARVVEGFWRFARRRPQDSLRALFERYVSASTLADVDRHYLAYVLNTVIEHEFSADIGDLSLASVSGGEDWPGSDALFPEGYRQIVDVLALGLDIRTEQVVKRIDYQHEDVILSVQGGENLVADAVVVTIPLGVLRSGFLEFVPELPPTKRRAIDALGMGVLNKTCLLFDEVFWPPDVELIGYVGTQPGQWAETVNLYPYTQQPILMMFNAGAYGSQIEDKSDSEIVNEALVTLTDMYESVSSLQDALITRWQSDPWSRGSYSYVPVGSSWAEYAELARPIQDRVFLAGEATHDDYPATVHGAFLSGLRAARHIAANEERRSLTR